MRPLISIIIPVYNRQKELMLSLNSIVKQTYRPLEVIIVDDGSEQPVEVKKQEIMTTLQNIPFQLVRQKNAGAPAARNHGFDLSNGECVLFWDADTLGNCDMVSKMYEALEQNSDAAFAYSNHIHAGKITFHSRPFDVTELKKINYINTMSLIRRNDFCRFDETLKRFQDWDLFLTLSEQGKKGIWIDEVLYTSVQTKGGISYWLPSFAYTFPWKYMPFFYKKVKAYEEAKKIIAQKHHFI